MLVQDIFSDILLTELSNIFSWGFPKCHFMFFCVSSQELTRALEKSPDDAECYCQRAYAHILLQNYTGNIFRQH